MSQQDSYKKEAAERAVELVQSGMVIGLGTGETATYAIRRIGALLQAGTLEDIEAVATSLATAAEAVRWGFHCWKTHAPRRPTSPSMARTKSIPP